MTVRDGAEDISSLWSGHRSTMPICEHWRSKNARLLTWWPYRDLNPGLRTENPPSWTWLDDRATHCTLIYTFQRGDANPPGNGTGNGTGNAPDQWMRWSTPGRQVPGAGSSEGVSFWSHMITRCRAVCSSARQRAHGTGSGDVPGSVRHVFSHHHRANTIGRQRCR